MNGMNDPASDFWRPHEGFDLAQGDYLVSCLVPIIPANLSTDVDEYHVNIGEVSLIVVTQSCDLANNKADFVSLCPVLTLDEWEAHGPMFSRRGVWEQVRKGRREGLHMLAGTDKPENNRSALVVDFRQIYSLPFEYLSNHAEQVGTRYRLQSPFVEHFSQAFARFFMRVGLPSAIPPFK